MKPSDWWRYRRVILNMRIFGCRIQIFLFGARTLTAKKGLKVDEFFWWRPLPRGESIIKGLY
jgi:hypothetical protein